MEHLENEFKGTAEDKRKNIMRLQNDMRAQLQ